MYIFVKHSRLIGIYMEVHNDLEILIGSLSRDSTVDYSNIWDNVREWGKKSVPGSMVEVAMEKRGPRLYIMHCSEFSEITSKVKEKEVFNENWKDFLP